MRWSVFLAVAALAYVLGACGAERANRPSTTVRPGDPTRRVSYPRVGLSLALPRNAFAQRRRSPGVFRAPVGQSFVAAFAYRRSEQLPRNRRELEAARRRLVREVNGRSRAFRLLSSRRTRVAGAPALELVGDQTIARSRLRTRSLHVFKGRGEYVIDMLAPVSEFPASNRNFFSPVVRSLRVTGRIPPSPRRG